MKKKTNNNLHARRTSILCIKCCTAWTKNTIHCIRFTFNKFEFIMTFIESVFIVANFAYIYRALQPLNRAIIRSCRDDMAPAADWWRSNSKIGTINVRNYLWKYWSILFPIDNWQWVAEERHKWQWNAINCYKNINLVRYGIKTGSSGDNALLFAIRFDLFRIFLRFNSFSRFFIHCLVNMDCLVGV